MQIGGMAELRIEEMAAGAGGRYLVVGDVHGCAEELEALLWLWSPGAEDLVVAAGDLINRGPASGRVLELARRWGIRSVVGNHEERLLAAWRAGDPLRLKREDRATYEQLREADWEWVASWPHIIRLPAVGALVVHGGLMPGVAVEEQAAEVVTRIQVLDERMRPAKRAEKPEGRAWGAFWEGPETVYYGHTPRPEVLVHAKAVGLDTGCVYGYELTAVELPAGKLYRVPARRGWAT